MVFGFGGTTSDKAPDSKLQLNPLQIRDLPDVEGPEFKDWLDALFLEAETLMESMQEWKKGSTYASGTVQSLSIPPAIAKSSNLPDYWVARESYHVSAPNTALPPAEHPAEGSPSQQALGLETVDAGGLYERFRAGLLESHTLHEKEYIESCEEVEQLEVFEEHIAEGEDWSLVNLRDEIELTSYDPGKSGGRHTLPLLSRPPTNPRTFVFLLLARQTSSIPGSRSFINISIPFLHPACPPKEGDEIKRVRGKYASVERVKEVEGGKVEWRMATASSAGGNIPQAITNMSLAGKISEDVPSFVSWMDEKFPGGAKVETLKAAR